MSSGIPGVYMPDQICNVCAEATPLKWGVCAYCNSRYCPCHGSTKYVMTCATHESVEDLYIAHCAENAENAENA